jgi:hypothetical protein
LAAGATAGARAVPALYYSNDVAEAERGLTNLGAGISGQEQAGRVDTMVAQFAQQVGPGQRAFREPSVEDQEAERLVRAGLSGGLGRSNRMRGETRGLEAANQRDTNVGPVINDRTTR